MKALFPSTSYGAHAREYDDEEYPYYYHNNTFILISEPNRVMKIWNLKTLKLVTSITIAEHVKAFAKQKILGVNVHQCTFSDNKLAVHVGYFKEDFGLEVLTLFWNVDSFNPLKENVQFIHLLHHTNINPNDDFLRCSGEPFGSRKFTYLNEKYFCVNFRKVLNDNIYVYDIENFDMPPFKINSSYGMHLWCLEPGKSERLAWWNKGEMVLTVFNLKNQKIISRIDINKYNSIKRYLNPVGFYMGNFFFVQKIKNLNGIFIAMRYIIITNEGKIVIGNRMNTETVGNRMNTGDHFYSAVLDNRGLLIKGLQCITQLRNTIL